MAPALADGNWHGREANATSHCCIQRRSRCRTYFAGAQQHQRRRRAGEKPWLRVVCKVAHKRVLRCAIMIRRALTGILISGSRLPLSDWDW